MPRPRLLDLFCGAGGAAKGYADAGFLVVGVDIAPQPRYPYTFYQADALEFVREHGHRFDAIHASPPCQALTTASNRWRGRGGRADSHPNLIPATREALAEAGRPFVIENVPGARRYLHEPVVLRGGSFGLPVDRPRLFECSFSLPSPPAAMPRLTSLGIYGALDGRRLTQKPRADGSHQYAPRTLGEARTAMGVDWMEWGELKEAIPPAYTRYVGEYLMRHLLSRSEAA